MIHEGSLILNAVCVLSQGGWVRQLLWVWRWGWVGIVSKKSRSRSFSPQTSTSRFYQTRGRSRILVRGAQQSLDPRGDLSPKFAQSRGFSLKLAWKLHDFGKMFRTRRGQAPGPPGSASAKIHCFFFLRLIERWVCRNTKQMTAAFLPRSTLECLHCLSCAWLTSQEAQPNNNWCLKFWAHPLKKNWSVSKPKFCKLRGKYESFACKVCSVAFNSKTKKMGTKSWNVFSASLSLSLSLLSLSHTRTHTSLTVSPLSLSPSLSVFVCLALSLSVSLCPCLSVPLSSLSLFVPSLYLSLFVCLSVPLSLCLSLCPLSLSLSLSVCVSLSLSLSPLVDSFWDSRVNSQEKQPQNFITRWLSVFGCTCTQKQWA